MAPWKLPLIVGAIAVPINAFGTGDELAFAITDADVQARMTLPADGEEQIQEMLRRVTTMASTAHFLWPIPERGLVRRLHRIKAETLIVWGADDRLASSTYAQDFADKIANSKVVIVPGAGHTPHFDQQDKVSEAIAKFLAP